MSEQWKKIEGWPYSVSDRGRVMNTRTGYILKPANDKDGYHLITLCNRGKQVTRWIHRLVAIAFLGDTSKGMMVNHKDGIKQNNDIENIEYVTRSGNEKHASEMGLKARGERNSKAKLTEVDVRTIRDLYKSGGYTQVRLGEIYGLSHRGIGHIVNRKNWKHVS